jgi:hypothetical protein
MVQFSDDWGDEHKARNPTNPFEYAILASDLPFYAEVIRQLSKREWQVYHQHYILKNDSTSDIARLIGVRGTSDVRTYISRIEKKIGQLKANLTLVKINRNDADAAVVEHDDLSRPQPSRHQVDPRKTKVTCLSSAPCCQQQERKAK